MSTLTNFVGCVKNNIRSKKSYVDVAFSLLIEKCLIILLNEGFILGYNQLNTRTFRVFLKYFKGRSVINDLNCISLPGFRKYWRISDVLKNYNKSTLVIISTPSGIFSDKTIIFKRRLFLNQLKTIQQTSLLTIPQISTPLIKNYNFYNIDQSIKFIFKDFNLQKIKLNDIKFHKSTVLKGFYRSDSLFNRVSRRHYIRNRNIRTFFKAYIKKSYILHNSVFNIENQLKNLTFFKFKNFFSNSNYLTFRKSKNFVRCINSLNSFEFSSIFYFIFYTKQLTFTGYRFRFSLYLKYINHLWRVISPSISLNSINNHKKLNMGGEPLLYIR